MAQTNLAALDAHQTGLFGGPPDLDAVQARRGVQDVREPLGACGRRQEQDSKGGLRQGGQIGGEEALQPGGHRKRVDRADVTAGPAPWRRLGSRADSHGAR